MSTDPVVESGTGQGKCERVGFMVEPLSTLDWYTLHKQVGKSSGWGTVLIMSGNRFDNRAGRFCWAT